MLPDIKHEQMQMGTHGCRFGGFRHDGLQTQGSGTTRWTHHVQSAHRAGAVPALRAVSSARTERSVFPVELCRCAEACETDRGDFAASRDAASAQRINQSLLDDVNRHNLEYNTYLLERDPDNTRAHVSLARAPFHAGQLPQAAAHLATARKFDPRDDDAARQDRSMIQEIQQSTRQILSFAGWTRQPHCVSYPSVP